ncbi:MAG: hypothetical protein AAF125_21525, partial [Chloroflexota bacterium]
ASYHVQPANGALCAACGNKIHVIPHIAGAWAAMRQAYPEETIEQIQDRLASSGTPIQYPLNGGA